MFKNKESIEQSGVGVYCTLKHVHHAEEGQRERGFAAACPATDPHLRKKEKKSKSPTLKC